MRSRYTPPMSTGRCFCPCAERFTKCTPSSTLRGGISVNAKSVRQRCPRRAGACGVDQALLSDRAAGERRSRKASGHRSVCSGKGPSGAREDGPEHGTAAQACARYEGSSLPPWDPCAPLCPCRLPREKQCPDSLRGRAGLWLPLRLPPSPPTRCLLFTPGCFRLKRENNSASSSKKKCPPPQGNKD